MSKKIELDPSDREWEYDGDGSKIYKLEAGKPIKTEWIENKLVDLDGGVPYKKDWIAESNEVTSKLNGNG